MQIDTRLLTLNQWLSPGFPTGAFAYSHGIETAVARGWISTAQELEDWLRDSLEAGSGRADAIWLRLAQDAVDPAEIDAMARTYATSHERLREADRQGAAFAGLVADVWGYEMPPLLLPVAVGHATGRARIDPDATVGLYLQSFVSNLVFAAIRLMPLGQTEGQRIILRLQDQCLSTVGQTRGAAAEDVFGNAFLSDIAAMAHDTLEPRLFQS